MLQFLSHVPEEIPADGDPVALVIVLVVVLAFTVWVLVNKRRNKAVQETVEEVVTAPAVELPKAPGAAGQLKLYNVEPKTAAMIMAIVADKMGKPLNELRFISIKEVE